MTLAPVALRRHTTKAYDPTRTLPPAVLEDLLEVLHNAPSSVNSQPWHFLVAGTPRHGRVSPAPRSPTSPTTPPRSPTPRM